MRESITVSGLRRGIYRCQLELFAFHCGGDPDHPAVHVVLFGVPDALACGMDALVLAGSFDGLVRDEDHRAAIADLVGRMRGGE